MGECARSPVGIGGGASGVEGKDDFGETAKHLNEHLKLEEQCRYSAGQILRKSRWLVSDSGNSDSNESFLSHGQPSRRSNGWQVTESDRLDWLTCRTRLVSTGFGRHVRSVPRVFPQHILQLTKYLRIAIHERCGAWVEGVGRYASLFRCRATFVPLKFGEFRPRFMWGGSGRRGYVSGVSAERTNEHPVTRRDTAQDDTTRHDTTQRNATN